MSEQTRVNRPIYSLLPTEVDGFDSLAELVLDMCWSWNHATDNVWRQLDPELWEITHNPWVVLQTVSRDRIERVLADPAFRKNVDGMVQTRREAMKRVRQPAGAAGDIVYSAAVSTARPTADYTARVIPHRDGVAILLEDARVLWQR